MLAELLEVIGGLANLSIPSSRREAFAYLAILAAMPLFGFGAVAFIDLASQTGSIVDNYLHLPWWVCWGIPVSGVVFGTAIVMIALDVRWERQALSRIGKRPRIGA